MREMYTFLSSEGSVVIMRHHVVIIVGDVVKKRVDVVKIERHVVIVKYWKLDPTLLFTKNSWRCHPTVQIKILNLNIERLSD